MNGITGTTALGVSVALFVISLIIMLALRKSDQNNRRLAIVKKLVEKLDADSRKTMEEFKQGLAEIEVEISRKEDNLHNLIQSGTSQINALSSYYDDFGNLSSAMQTYKKALEGVQRLTESTDDKIQGISNDVNRLEEVRQLIESFREEIDNIRQAAVDQVEKAATDADREIDGAVESLKSESAIMKESFRSEVSAFVDDTAERMKNVVAACVDEINDRICQMNQISAKLAAQQEQLELLERQQAEREAAAAAAPEAEPVSEPGPEPDVPTFVPIPPQPEPVFDDEPEVSVDTQFDIRNMDFDMAPEPEPEPEPEPVPEPEPMKKFEYTGEDEEVIFS